MLAQTCDRDAKEKSKLVKNETSDKLFIRAKLCRGHDKLECTVWSTTKGVLKRAKLKNIVGTSARAQFWKDNELPRYENLEAGDGAPDHGKLCRNSTGPELEPLSADVVENKRVNPCNSEKLSGWTYLKIDAALSMRERILKIAARPRCTASNVSNMGTERMIPNIL